MNLKHIYLIICAAMVITTSTHAAQPTGTVTRAVAVYTNTGLLVDTNFTRVNGIADTGSVFAVSNVAVSGIASAVVAQAHASAAMSTGMEARAIAGTALQPTSYAPDLAASIVRLTNAVDVTGSLSTDCTGHYVEVGQYDGMPAYSNTTRLGVIFVVGGWWYLVATNSIGVETLGGEPPPQVWGSTSKPQYPCMADYEALVFTGATGTPVLVDSSTYVTNRLSDLIGGNYGGTNVGWRYMDVLVPGGSTNTIRYLGAP